MLFLIDTNVAVLLRDDERAAADRVASLGGEVALSIVTVVELEGGVYRDLSQAEQRRPRLDALLKTLDVLDFDAEAAAAYGRIVAAVGYSRRKLLDRMIAAQALVRSATLVTLNGDDFRDVPGLRLLEW